MNPFAPQLTFASTRTRTRRDHQKYLALIRTVALLHQHQRDIKRHATASGDIEYIEVVPADIAIANRLAHEVLGRSLDELPPQTRRLLLLLDEMVRSDTERHEVARNEVRFTRKEVRGRSGWGNSQLAVHLARLADLEYIVAFPTGRARTYAYELVWNGEADGAPTLDGLIDPETLTYDATRPGSEVTVPGLVATHPPRFRPGSGAVPAPVRGAENGHNGNGHKDFSPFGADSAENAVPGSDDAVCHVVPVSAAG